MNILKGAFTALVTPMNADGSVDFDGFRANVKYQLENGIDGLVPLGTTAETPTLDDKPGSEEDKIIEIVFEEVRKFEKTSNKKSQLFWVLVQTAQKMLLHIVKEQKKLVQMPL